MNGRDHFYEFLLYSKTNYGIEIKMLPLLSRIGDKEGGGNDTNGQTVWIYRRITNATPRFDPERLILKVDAVHNGQGYKTEYVFENNEFKLTKFTKLSIHMRTNPETQKYEPVQESEDIYP
ncbi:hypothetical protein [Pseudanabaena sp. 'Roaring Creek']|uniref:hypothetical protein n=1 Tax=Pseudanabaena sp. 'Roaring Creek' TaxID=1681830 RepID=UPI0006D7BA6A|nr:hypothetical protein [Pseudanabaena sp. 'Roaring Creek']